MDKNKKKIMDTNNREVILYKDAYYYLYNKKHLSIDLNVVKINNKNYIIFSDRRIEDNDEVDIKKIIHLLNRIVKDLLLDISSLTIIWKTEQLDMRYILCKIEIEQNEIVDLALSKLDYKTLIDIFNESDY
jgi:hypothetical protein